MKVYQSVQTTSLLLCSIGITSARMAEAIPLTAFAQVNTLGEETYAQVIEDVKRSGYYFMLCNNIAEAWRVCSPDFEHEEDPLIPDYCNLDREEGAEEPSVSLENQCQMVNDLAERKCRNNVLFYYAGMYNTEVIWEALAAGEEERAWLIDKCHTIFVASEALGSFPLAPGEEDVLMGALSVDDLPRGLANLRTTGADEWEHLDAENGWEFDGVISLVDEATEVNGQYSMDLDLFYTEEAMVNLFDYECQHYKKICSLVRTTMMSENISEVNDLTAALTESEEFNYISEDESARNTLYTICSFNTYFPEEDQQFLAEHRAQFDLLFS